MDIQRFESFEALTREIIADRESNDMLAQRYAVRFSRSRNSTPIFTMNLANSLNSLKLLSIMNLTA